MSFGPVPTDGILSFLKSSKPGDALCVLGLTLSDLYPREAWTFTFGTFLPGHGEPAPRDPAPALGLGHRPGVPRDAGPSLWLPGPSRGRQGCLPQAAFMGTPGGAGPSGPVHPGGRGFARGLSELRPRLVPPASLPSPRSGRLQLCPVLRGVPAAGAQHA